MQPSDGDGASNMLTGPLEALVLTGTSGSPYWVAKCTPASVISDKYMFKSLGFRTSGRACSSRLLWEKFCRLCSGCIIPVQSSWSACYTEKLRRGNILVWLVSIVLSNITLRWQWPLRGEHTHTHFLGEAKNRVPVFFPESGPVGGALVGLATSSPGPWSPGLLAPGSPGLLVPWSPGPWSPGPLCLCFASSY